MAAAGEGWATRASNRRGQGIGVDAALLLVQAGEQSTLEATRIALELGADVNATDPDGNTALHAAVQLAYPSVVDLLIEHGSKLDVKNNDDQSPQDLMCFDADGGWCEARAAAARARAEPGRLPVQGGFHFPAGLERPAVLVCASLYTT